MPAARYIHGTSPVEQTRLGWMNQLLNRRELAAIAPEGAEHALELGAGTGLFLRALAERLPHGSVVGVERESAQLEAARAACTGLANVELRQGDVLDPPLRPEEWGSFDLVHARFLLEHLTQPAEAVAVMARAVRPGGCVVLADDDHDTLRLWPAAPAFERLWRAYCEQYTLRGMDPWIGRRLTGLLADAGLRPLRTELLFFGASAGMELFPVALANLEGVVGGAAEDVLGAGTLDEPALVAGLREIRAWGERPDAALWYAVPFAVGQRPA